jgi:hypothetical protein
MVVGRNCFFQMEERRALFFEGKISLGRVASHDLLPGLKLQFGWPILAIEFGAFNPRAKESGFKQF